MSLLDIVQHPNTVLRQVCGPVTSFDDGLRKLAADMLDTMYDAPGRGLAAPQVGVPLRLFVMDVAWKTGAPEPMVMVNPDVLEASAETVLIEEGCLSIPGIPCPVVRPSTIRLRWHDLDGKVTEATLEGALARCAQHELDHLDGILCIDRIEGAA